MRFKSYVSVLTVTAVSSLTIAGCAGEPSATSVQPASSAAPATSGTTPAATADNPYKDKLDLKFFLASSDPNSNLPAGDKDFVKKAIEQKFNVSLNVTYMPFGTDRTNKSNILVASGDTPDLLLSLGTDSQKYIVDKVVADVKTLFTPENMPNYFKWVTPVELTRYQIIGEIFGRVPIPFARDVNRSYYIRQDWLDKLGLKVPTSYDEMKDVMRAFTNKDPDGNGKKDTFGLTASGNGNSISLDFPEYIKNGLIGSFMIDNNHLIDVQSDPRMENVMDDIKATLAEGIVDPDWFLQKGTANYDKAAQGKAGIFASTSRNIAFDSIPTSVQSKTKAVVPTANWVAFSPFATSGNWTDNLPGNSLMLGGKSSPEKLKRTAAIIDWLCSEEGFLLTHYGIENKHYTRSGKTITLKPDAFTKDIVEQGNFLDIWNTLTPDEPRALGLDVIDPRMTDHDRAIIKTIQGYKNIPSIGTNVSPPQGFNLADFRAKMREYQVKILFDEKDASNWPKYREELMTKYKGNDMIKTYEDQIRAAGVIK